MERQSNNNLSGGTKQRYGEIENNPLVLSEDYTKQAIEYLNTDLASHFISYFQFKKQHWIVDGPDWKHISEALDGYAKTVQSSADELAERINVLGGIPLSNPSRFADLSYIQFEGEDKLDLRTMLQNDLAAEQQAIKQMRERVDFVKQNKDHGSDELLKDILEGHEKIAHELHHYLQSESLERSIKDNK